MVGNFIKEGEENNLDFSEVVEDIELQYKAVFRMGIFPDEKNPFKKLSEKDKNVIVQAISANIQEYRPSGKDK